jgi:hypothetical protein
MGAYPLAYEEGIELSETLAIKLHTPEINPNGNIQPNYSSRYGGVGGNGVIIPEILIFGSKLK